MPERHQLSRSGHIYIPSPGLWGLHMALVWLLITANTVIVGEFSCGIIGPRAEKMQPVAK